MMTLRALNLRSLVRAVLIPLIIGWLVALIFGLWLTRLQYVELFKMNQDGDGVYPDSRWWVARVQNPNVDSAYPPARIAAMLEERLDREIRRGPLLLLLQVGVMTGALAWQVSATAQRATNRLLYGGAAGVVLGIIQGVIAVIMQAPWGITVPLVGVLIGVGVYAGWSAKAS